MMSVTFTSYTFKPQLRTVGPKYGKYLKQIQQTLASLDGNQAMAELKAEGALKLDNIQRRSCIMMKRIY